MNMRNRMKKLFKNEKGFTLVELLAVIVILGIIVAIAIPAISGIIDRAQDGADDAEVTLIIDAARLYRVEHTIDATGVHTDDLITEGYLEMRESVISGTVTYDSTRTPAYEFDED